MGKGDGSRQQLSSGSVGTHDVSLVELALVVVDDVGAGGEVRRHEDVGPVAGPARVALVVVRRRRRPPACFCACSASAPDPAIAGAGAPGVGVFAHNPACAGVAVAAGALPQVPGCRDGREHRARGARTPGRRTPARARRTRARRRRGRSRPRAGSGLSG